MTHRNRIFIFCSFQLALSFLVFAAAAAVSAADLSAYRAKIHAAGESLDILIYSDEEESNQAENIRLERETLRQIRAAFPAAENVRFRSGDVEVDNAWLLEKLKAFENEKEPTARTALLREISERLAALEAKLAELENSADAVRSKDEDKQKLAEILRRAEYRKPEEQQEGFFRRAWREFWERFGATFPRARLGAPSPDGMQSFSVVLQIIIFVLVAGALGFLAYRFAPFLRGRFKSREKKDNAARVVLGEHLAADQTSSTLFSEAEKLAGEGNLRAAIRKGYIALLCDLSDRRIIGLAQHKTNRDYLRDVKNQTELYQNMSGLTGSYERHWYGAVLTGEQDWEEFRKGYRKTVGKSS